MKISSSHKSKIIGVISMLYILLFVYAASSKLLDFKNFQIQLGQSPMLSAYAGWVAVLIPFLEIFISISLIFPKWRLKGLYASFSMMVLFSTYIIIILKFSSYVPCSCGGILEKLGWTEHLIFNIAFVLLALLAIYLHSVSKLQEKELTKTGFWFSIVILFLGSISVVIFLFVSSEAMIHLRNPFVRRFIPHYINKIEQKDLQYNSYYFAGAENGRIFLGNYTNPSIVTVMDTALQNKKTYSITLDNEKMPFRSIQLKVVPPYFYILDGTVPCIFKGKISNWKANLLRKGGTHFSAVTIVNDSTIAFRTRDTPNKENSLGMRVFGKPDKNKLVPSLLERQIDGVFDTDGSLLYSTALEKLIYVYYYRNQFIVSNSTLELEYRGRTIDTNSVAKIKIDSLPQQGIKKFSAPPFTVNAASYAFKNLLFVHSTLEGKYDSPKLWEQAQCH